MTDKDETSPKPSFWPYLLFYAWGGLFMGSVIGYQYLARLMSLEPKVSALICGAIGAVAGAIGGLSAWRTGLQHTAEVQQVAQKLGGQYLPGDAELNRRLSADFNFSDARMSDVVSKDLQGARLEVGDLQITRKSTGDDERSTTSVQSAAFFTVEGLRFPHFQLQPQGAMLKLLKRVIGGEKIEFPAQPYFAQIYDLSATHADNTRRLFNDEILNSLVRRPGLHIRASADALLIYEPGRQYGPAELEGFVAEVTRLSRLFEASARRTNQEDETRVTPKVDVRALADKMPGLMGMIVRSNLVTRSDLNAFVSQAVPREIPPNILKYRERVAPRVFLFIGGFLAIFGAMWLAPAQAQTGTAGATMTIGLVLVTGGVLIAGFAALARMRIARLLRRGELGTAIIESVNLVAWRGRLHVASRYQAEGRDWRVTSTWYPATNSPGDAQRRAQDFAAKKKPAPILYTPGAPRRMLFIDELLNVSEEFEP